MRISCVAYARLRGPNGTYALILNAGRLDRSGQRTVSPVGGSLTHKKPGLTFLTKLGAQNFENDKDLRFTVPDSRVSKVTAWFHTRKGRETTVMREFFEELVTESGLLARADLWAVEENFARCR